MKPPESGTGPGTVVGRKETIVAGKRMKVIDVHAHCAVPEALALMGLKLGEFWKYRIGGYRLICSIEDQILRILILRVGHLREIYR